MKLTQKKFDKLKDELAKITSDGWDYKADAPIRCNEKYVIFHNGQLVVHNDNGTDFCDFYEGMGYPWIHRELLRWAKEKGYKWEWRDPGAIVLYED